MLAKIIAALFAIWFVWLGYQYFSKSGTAHTLVTQKIAEFDAMDLNTLAAKVGKGYEYQEVEARGKKYWIRWIVRKPQPAPGETLAGSIEVRGRVDYIDLLPFGLFDFRAGAPFRFIFNLNE